MTSPHHLRAQPRVTALLCNYNYGRYLHDAISSALSQTWPDVEVIVVDDGSTDNSRVVIESFGQKIRHIYKENGGQASAFNAGIAASTGEIICFLDSDDVWLPGKVSEVVDKFRSGDWALVCHQLQAIYADGTPIPEEDLRYRPDAHLEEGTTASELFFRGYPWIFSPTSGMSLRSSIARSLLPIPERTWRICADNPIAYGSVCFGNLGVIRKQLGQYRHHSTNGFASLRHSGAGYSVELTLLQVKRHLYIQHVLKEHNASNWAKETPYPLFRAICFMASPYPVAHAIEIVRRSMRHGKSPDGIKQEGITERVGRTCIDLIRAALITLKLRPRMKAVRKQYWLIAQEVDPDVKSFIQKSLQIDAPEASAETSAS